MDAKAPSTEEGRGKLRKAWGSCKQILIPRYPNVETRLVADQSLMTEYIGHAEGTRGTETSKYPEEKKETSISKVAASEMERAQTEEHAFRGCGPAKCTLKISRTVLESTVKGRKNRVGENWRGLAGTRVPQDT